MIAELVYLGLGFAIGYVASSKERRKKALQKLNEWTKPKKEAPAEVKPKDA